MKSSATVSGYNSLEELPEDVVLTDEVEEDAVEVDDDVADVDNDDDLKVCHPPDPINEPHGLTANQ